MIRPKRTILLIITLLSFFSLNAQTKQAEAFKLFNEAKYAEAAEIYSSIIESANRDISVNYYYGVCLYYLNRDIDEAIKRLKFSSTPRPVSPDVFYYLGKLYQQVYEMELAIEQLNRFLKLNKTESPKIEDAEKTIEDCHSSIKLINKYFNIEVLKKDTVEKNSILSYIKLSKDAGVLMLSQNFFVSGVQSNQLIFRTERGNEVLFPMQENDNTWNLYRIIKLLDSWSEPEELGSPVNSDYDELYPFLSIDGVTLYFSSNRPGGMGGFDIYQSFYDPETGTFSEPANMGPPFNSPYDDFLLVTDEYEEKAWFVTNRGVENDKNIVVEIVWDDNVIKNNTENIHQLLQIASLPLSEKSSIQTSDFQGQKSGQTQQKSEKSINFIINDTLIYQRVEQFWSEDALEAFNAGYNKEQEKNSLLSQLDNKRKEYSQSYDKNEQNRLFTEILSLEQQTYSLEDEVIRKYLSARRLELETINQLKSEGKYEKAEAEEVVVEDEDEEDEEEDEEDEEEDVSENNIEMNLNNAETIEKISFEKLEYKIQIGSFRNQPDPKAMAKIPEVTKSIKVDNGLTKYFSGSWAKYSEASSFVNIIREAGFPGAFVVPFLDDEQISVEKAKEIEDLLF